MIAVSVITLDAESRILRGVRRCAVAAVIVIVALQCAALISYLFYPSYLNHAEAFFAAVSWLGWEGHPLYPRLDGGDVYGLPYGPALYQLTGFSLWLLGPSIGASKVFGLTAFALSQVLSFLTLRRSGAGVAGALTMTGVQCVVLAGFTDQGYVSGVRSDALLFLAAQTAVLVATARPTMITAGALGLLAGFCANLKIHGGLYILPVFVYLLCRSPSTAVGLRLTCIAGLSAAIIFAVPFAPNNASFVEYYHSLQALSHHPWNRWLFEQNIVFETMLILPFFSMYLLFMPKFPRTYLWFVTVLVLCMTLVAFPAAASGAGPHHLLPFLPPLVWGFTIMRREVSASLRDPREKGRYQGLCVGLMFALVFGYGPIVITAWSTMLHLFADAPLVNEGIAEIDRALNENPGLRVAVGPGAAASFDAQRLRVIPVFRGNPLPIDSTAWADFKQQGISDQIVRRAITDCRVDIWLLPTGAPFITESGYDGANIYSAEVLAGFHATYLKQTSGPIFDQWRCRPQDVDSGADGVTKYRNEVHSPK